MPHTKKVTPCRLKARKCLSGCRMKRRPSQICPPMTANTYTEHDPLISEGCGVHRSQVSETRDLIKKYGIQGAAVLDGGQIRFTSRRARKQFLAMRGLVDNDGSYND